MKFWICGKLFCESSLVLGVRVVENVPLGGKNVRSTKMAHKFVGGRGKTLDKNVQELR